MSSSAPRSVPSDLSAPGPGDPRPARRVSAWRGRSNDLPLDGHGGADPAHDACRAWREEGVRLGIAGVSMLRPGDPHAPVLDAVPVAAVEMERAAEAVRDALAEDRYAGLAWL